MKAKLGQVAAWLTLCCAAQAAEPMCPWLNAATAEGVLEGPVQTTVAKNGDDATCEFSRRDSSGKLRIEVVAMHASRDELAAYQAECSVPGVPLKAIGNQALACSVDTRNREVAEQVVGRVRRQAFLVRVSSSASGFERQVLREKAEKVAEQVAGNLF